ncbi:crotonobetainyl-CoA:carnitine CoA-transferase CaiB-like acyl-CoA transferase [Microbacterium sp. AK009]|uniref:CoA transferase n=1 Tax=Microbacterium sp. AK009 TaxID=2723068 RepID=UPI0015CA42B3|nr:CoA transferase [Microbacterium sp. AK009]NYF15644.1 crotonobetainyl-CoA:carnitine CoA-transferase CaiB-like acyl-CoA transferase [Microbacterium sp. AK009]
MTLGAVGTQVADALGIDPAARERIAEPTGSFPWGAHLPVGTLATDSVALASLAIALHGARSGRVRVDRERVAASFGSERLLRINGAAPSAWAPLSGFWRAADGWMRTHANYPHHERALRTLLGLPDDAGTDAAAAAISARSAAELEHVAAERGAIVGRVRTPEEWLAHPQGHVVAAAPIIERRRWGHAAPRTWPGDAAPLAGVRVLDLTRVIAGPIATRDLRLAGAEVLRVDSPRLPETGWIHLDTGQGKRSTLLDLGRPIDRKTFERLLARAHVVVTGYRPGALTRFGLNPGELAERHPGLITASISAWGTEGPWAARRGFDSIVQAVSGIATIESADGKTPGALPVQALDHATGHFLAAAIVQALGAQRQEGGSTDIRMSLARTAHALLTSADPATEPASLITAPPPLAFPGAPEHYPVVGGEWGADAPDWLS